MIFSVQDGWAEFLEPNKVKVTLKDKSEKVLTAEHILIATGGKTSSESQINFKTGHPTIPNIPGSELGITSDGFFDIESLPKKGSMKQKINILVVVVGSGYIAVELAGILRALGSDVSMILRNKIFLRTFDQILRETLFEEYKNTGVKFFTENGVTKVEYCYTS